MQVVIRAQALQTQTPPPLQSMENVVSVSTTAGSSKDDLEMSKVCDCRFGAEGRVVRWGAHLVRVVWHQNSSLVFVSRSQHPQQ